MQNYIPSRNVDFNLWLLNFSALLTLSPTTYGLIAGDATAVAAVVSSWSPAYAAAQDPTTRTSVTVQAQLDARIAALIVVRPYAVRISQNAAVASSDKTAIGVTVRQTVPTPVPAPTVQPALALVSAISLRQTIDYKQPGATNKAKPVGSIGMEVWRNVGTVAATDPAQCGYINTVTKSPFLQDFASGDKGKVCTTFTRFVTRSGPGGVAQYGPWSDALINTIM